MTYKTYILALLVFFALPVFAASPAPTKPLQRFFLVGDGTVTIKNQNTGRVVSAAYLKPEGSFDDAVFQKIDWVFGFPTAERGEGISKRLIATLDYFSDLLGKGRQINMISAYRSPQHNQNLRNAGKTAAKTSTHLDGMALDFYLDAWTPNEAYNAWETIRQKNCCGVGHYGGKSIHLDSGKPRFWQQATSKVFSGASDHNKYIYYSTEFDRYAAGEQVRTFFTAVSDFGFGVKAKARLVPEGTIGETAVALPIKGFASECTLLKEHKDTRFLYVTLPDDLSAGRYQLKIDFCNRPFEDMPEGAVSGVIVVVK